MVGSGIQVTERFKYNPSVTLWQEMKKRLFAMFLLGALIAGCATGESDPEQRTISGYLKHFPSNIRSSQAWHGHHFMVGNTPVIPTDQVPEEVLKKFVGALVMVTGVWHPGERWIPAEEEMNMPMPVDPDKGIIIKGDGLQVSSIKLVK